MKIVALRRGLMRARSGDAARAHARVLRLTNRHDLSSGMHIGWPQLFVAVVAFAGSVGASALGFGSIRSSVVLGQPLNLAVPVSLAEGESLAADCASAEVISGDTKLPPGSVRVRVRSSRSPSDMGATRKPRCVCGTTRESDTSKARASRSVPALTW